MYAIVKTGGKQYRVEPGQTLLVERLPDDAGATVALEPILFRSDDAVFDAEGLKKVSVNAKVVMQLAPEGDGKTAMAVHTDAAIFGKLGEFGQAVVRRKVSQVMDEFAANVSRELTAS